MKPRDYWQAIHEKVCMNCIDSDGHGNCRLDPAVECALQMHLPLIIQVVNKITSSSMDDYVRELRAIVCNRCKYETVNGTCGLRAEVDCALDRYFPLVVQAIEEVNRQAERDRDFATT